MIATEAPTRGVLRRLLLRLAMFALVVTGLHAGADHLDDLVFTALDVADRAADRLLAVVIGGVGEFFALGPEWIEKVSYLAAEVLDFDEKLAASRVIALLLEAAADLIFALTVLDPRAQRTTLAMLKTAVHRALLDPTLLRIAGPVAMAGATLAGVAVVAREMQVAAHELSTHAELAPHVAAALARGLGLVALSVSLLVLGVRAVVRSAVRGDLIAEQDRIEGVKERTRRLKGAWTLMVALPLAFIALGDSALIAAVRSLVLQ